MDKEVSDFELYKLFRGENLETYKLHRDAFQHYLTFTSGILAATIAGIIQINGQGIFGLIVLVGPVINVAACILAINMCNRSYSGSLERIVILSKLEEKIGLQNATNLELQKKGKTNPIFPKDKYFLPERWIRGINFATSAEFVKHNLNTGVNRIAKQSFYLIISMNVLLAIAIVFIAIR